MDKPTEAVLMLERPSSKRAPRSVKDGAEKAPEPQPAKFPPPCRFSRFDDLFD